MQKSLLSPPSESFSSSSLSVAVCSPQIHKPYMDMQPNIWLMLLLHDARGWGQQTANPALLTSGRGEMVRGWLEEEEWMGKKRRGERDGRE